MTASASQRLRDRARSAWPVAVAASAWAGALVARPVPPAVVAAVAATVLIARRWVPAWLVACVVVALLVDVLALRALAGLDDVSDSDFAGTVSMVTDPEPTLDGGLRFEVDSTEGHLLAEVANGDAARIETLLAGHRLRVEGRVGPLRRPSEWTRSRHLTGTLEITAVAAVSGAPAHLELANGFRRLLRGGAESLSDEERSLLVGIVIGDDRAQPPELTSDFRASGLTHLLAVSGQNLVFVLAVASPLLRRLRIWPRYVAAVTIVAAFATVTRFEPSVVRAAAVATIALLATTIGRAGDGIRHLALAVVALLVVDPLLVHSVGFRLSVAASVGVLVLAPPLIARLRGPRWLRDGLGVTIAAQLAVAPVLVPTFGPMPLAAVPANVLAGPVAGSMMVWGLVAGTIAGIVEGPVARVLHVPTRGAVAALEWISRWGAGAPLGRIDLRHVAVVAVAALVWRVHPRLRAGAVALVALVVVSAVSVRPALGERRVGFDSSIWVDGRHAVVVASASARPVDVLDELRVAQVRAVPLVVSIDGDRSVRDAVAARFPVAAAIGPEGSDGITVPSGARIRVGRILVVVDDVGRHLRVRVGWR